MRHGFLCLVLVLGPFLLTGCASISAGPRPPPYAARAQTVRMLVTAYCPCEQCCGWTRNASGQPVFAYGSKAGQAKPVGICADGNKARKGTVAADTQYYPFGSRMNIPGYGWGVVMDRGGAITGPGHIDIFFPSHNQALKWGRRILPVTVYSERRR